MAERLAAMRKDTKICLVGHFPARRDNRGDLGTKQVGFQIATVLRGRHEIMEVNIREPLSWRRVRGFEPQIIHFILGPSMSGLVAARLCALYCNSAKTVLSAPNPDVPLRQLGAFLRPDLVLVQARDSETMFRSMGCSTRFFPNGVDLERFVPASPRRKAELRNKHGIGRDGFVILHVGPIIERRNVELLEKIQSATCRSLLVGRLPAEKHSHQSLVDAGCMVLTEYLERIEEVYALSDCYVFPTPPANKEASIEMPLSVMEAMSCNLPVVTTRFGALPRVFEEGDGFIFVDTDSDLLVELRRLRPGQEVRTREKVSPYSWESNADKLERIYEELMAC